MNNSTSISNSEFCLAACSHEDSTSILMPEAEHLSQHRQSEYDCQDLLDNSLNISPVQLRQNFANNPLFIIGTFGYGKSNIVKALCKSFHSHENPCEIFAVNELDINQAKSMILNFNSLQLSNKDCHLPYHRLDWPLANVLHQPTNLEVAPSFNKLDYATAQFIKEADLTDHIYWLQNAAPNYFKGAEFEIELLQGEDGENILALKVYASFSMEQFRKNRHSIFSEMLETNHKSLYDILSIFQRKVDNSSGWKTFSWYGALSKE